MSGSCAMACACKVDVRCMRARLEKISIFVFSTNIACPYIENTRFHLRPAAYGEMLISTTTSMGRTKILQFLPLRPPLGRTTKTCFCVGSDGHIRVECGSTHPSTRGYMILATTNPHSSPIQPNPHKSLQYLANHKVYIELNASFESIL